MHHLKLKVNIVSGNKSLKLLKKNITDLSFKNELLICDDVLKKNIYIKKNTKNIKNKLFIKFKTEPTYQMLNEYIKKIKKTKIDCIVAIGGGSTMDFAKGLATLYTNPVNSLKLMGFPKNINKPLPVITVPSTTSTGSEVTYNAVFTDIVNKKKLGINSEKNYPILAILDPFIISQAPKNIIYQSSLASLMRSIETFVTKDSNEITKYFSKISFNLLVKSLTKNKLNIGDYENLQWGCIFSMLALSNSSSGPCGVINYFLSSNYKISQPLSYCFSAIEFIKFNIDKKYYYYGDILGKKLNSKINSFKLLKLLNQIQNNIKKEILETKSNLSSQKDIEIKIFNVFKSINFLPLEKNPIKIKPSELKIIITKVIN